MTLAHNEYDIRKRLDKYKIEIEKYDIGTGMWNWYVGKIETLEWVLGEYNE